MTADAVRRANARLQRRLRAVRVDHGVSAGKLMILGQLHRAGAPMTAVDLARLERLQPQSLTRIIAELDGAGLVTRRPHAEDRRHILIEITPAGTALLVEDARAQNAWLAGAIEARLSGMEQALLALAVPLLERLTEE